MKNLSKNMYSMEWKDANNINMDYIRSELIKGVVSKILSDMEIIVTPREDGSLWFTMEFYTKEPVEYGLKRAIAERDKEAEDLW